MGSSPEPVASSAPESNPTPPIGFGGRFYPGRSALVNASAVGSAQPLLVDVEPSRLPHPHAFVQRGRPGLVRRIHRQTDAVVAEAAKLQEGVPEERLADPPLSPRRTDCQQAHPGVALLIDSLECPDEVVAPLRHAAQLQLDCPPD